MDELKKREMIWTCAMRFWIDCPRMRCQIIQEITNYKQKNGLPIYQAEEEGAQEEQDACEAG